MENIYTTGHYGREEQTEYIQVRLSCFPFTSQRIKGMGYVPSPDVAT